MNSNSWAMVFFCITICCRLQAQGPAAVANKLSPKSQQKTPNVAAMEKFGDYPVNLYTGLPDISVPIFEVKSGPLHLPIRLSYHASGIKYTDQASWVGLGWSLMAGGFISRNVNNKPDETSFLRNINNYEVPNTPDCSFYEYKKMSVDLIDREADLFSYQAPGHSGKFYLRQGGADPFLIPNLPLKISYTENLDQFEMLDENGIRYRFGKGSNEDRATEYITSGGSEGYVSTWYLMEISAPDTDDFISFSYQNVGKFHQQAVNNRVTLLDDCTFLANNDLDCPNLDTNISTLYSNTSATQLGISEIRFKTGMVKFILGSNRLDQPGLNHLDRIEVYEKAGNDYLLLKQVEFDLNQYFQNRSRSENYRLKLDGLLIKDGANTLINQYSFAYYTDSFSWDQANNSFRIDNFGFFNNKPNADLIPPTEVDLTTGYTVYFGSADRDTDTTYLKEGTLKRITYPTGGYSEFDFEPHQYRILDKVHYAGGLRVKNVRTFTGTDMLIKTYAYGGHGPGSGYKNFTLDKFLYSNTRYFKTGTSTSSLRYRSRMYFSNAVTGRGYEECPVVYPIVTEYETGGPENGKTVYEFDNKLHIPDKVVGYPFGTSTKPFINSMAWARGKLTRKTIYDGKDEIQAVTSIQYKNYRPDEQPIGQGVHQYVYQSGNFSHPYFTMCRQNIILYDAFEYIITTQNKTTGVYKRSKMEEKLLSPGFKDFTTVTEYQYHPDFLQLVKEEKRTDASPRSTIKVSRYVSDLSAFRQQTPGQAFVYHQMFLQNRLHTPIETYTSIKHGEEGEERIISGQVTTFKESFRGTGRYKIDEVYFFEAVYPVKRASYSQARLDDAGNLKADERYQSGIRIDRYDRSGNVIQMSRAGGKPSAFLYGVDGSFPVAMVENAERNQIAFTSFESKERGGWNYEGKEIPLPETSAKAGKKVYLLSNGHVSGSIPGASENNVFKLSFWAKAVSGVRTWSFMGKSESLTTEWKLIERSVTNPTVVIKGEGIYIDELRLHPEEAQMTTFTYAPLRGITSVLDSRNAAMFYEYDAFGRLASVRDQDGFLKEYHEYSYLIP